MSSHAIGGCSLRLLHFKPQVVVDDSGGQPAGRDSQRDGVCVPCFNMDASNATSRSLHRSRNGILIHSRVIGSRVDIEHEGANHLVPVLALIVIDDGAAIVAAAPVVQDGGRLYGVGVAVGEELRPWWGLR